mmetsp:Transcript_2917/g.6140  ORF Transcript_2917/g.6140 Transcript_2917/m.6140 type:complete len:119 (+) Transcript_2917:224-580(+)
MAATLFVRPQPSALLRVPLPSPWLLRQIEEEKARDEETRSNETSNRDRTSNTASTPQQPKNNKNKTNKKKPPKTSSKPPVTFDAWLKRVARNYEKQSKRRQRQPQKKEVENPRAPTTS